MEYLSKRVSKEGARLTQKSIAEVLMFEEMKMKTVTEMRKFLGVCVMTKVVSSGAQASTDIKEFVEKCEDCERHKKTAKKTLEMKEHMPDDYFTGQRWTFGISGIRRCWCWWTTCRCTTPTGSSRGKMRNVSIGASLDVHRA